MMQLHQHHNQEKNYAVLKIHIQKIKQPKILDDPTSSASSKKIFKGE